MKVRDEGSILLLVPVNNFEREWLAENVGEDNGYQPLWPTVVVEARYVDAIISGVLDAGFAVTVS